MTLTLEERCRQRAEELVQKFCRMPIMASILEQLDRELSKRYTFHSAAHTRDVLYETLLFALCADRSPREIELLAIAAAYHDAGFLQNPECHEEVGAEMARKAMLAAGGYTAEEADHVASMIRDTRLVPTPAGRVRYASSELSKYLLDADVSNFGRGDFFERLSLLLSESNGTEMHHLRQTLEMMEEHAWFTPVAESLRQKKKEQNLKQLKELVAERTR